MLVLQHILCILQGWVEAVHGSTSRMRSISVPTEAVEWTHISPSGLCLPITKHHHLYPSSVLPCCFGLLHFLYHLNIAGLWRHPPISSRNAMLGCFVVAPHPKRKGSAVQLHDIEICCTKCWLVVSTHPSKMSRCCAAVRLGSSFQAAPNRSHPNNSKCSRQ